tara:strand:+ start:329 stop:565 length:237 start_codon:yes stop_codon:yes gene_type:complete
MNLNEIKLLIQNNSICQLEEKEKELLKLIEEKDDVSIEGEKMSNILAAKEIIKNSNNNNTEIKVELREFFKNVRKVVR